MNSYSSFWQIKIQIKPQQNKWQILRRIYDKS